jgi:hypothetical protein
MTAPQLEWLAELARELERRVLLEISDVGGDDILNHYPTPVSEVVDCLVEKYDLTEVG